MSKYNILIAEEKWGDEWLDALNFNYYLFLKGSLFPTPEQITHIRENHNNQITDDVTFGNFSLQSRRGVEVEGLALRRRGPRHENFVSGFYAIDEYKEIKNEPLQRTREFETVVRIKTDNGSNYNKLPAQAGRTWGWAAIAFNYDIYKRATTTRKNGYSRHKIFDYYKIPDLDNEGAETNLINYIPLEKDFKFSQEEHDPPCTDLIFPYTDNIGELLKCIIDGSYKIGELLETMLHSIDNFDPKIGFNGLLQLVDKTGKK